MDEDDKLAGEDSLIQTYFAPLTSAFSGAYGLKEDCAALTPEPGHDLVLTTDAISEGIHFRPGDAPEDIAWRSVAVNVSDLAAKGARPIGYLLSLAFPELPDRDWLKRFTNGLREAQDQFGIVLMGGDTDRRPGSPLSATVMAVGSVPQGCMIRRGTARPGDLIYVSGTLGDAAIGLRVSASAPVTGLADDDRAFLEKRYLRPQPRVALRNALLAHARAAMDISDGLAKDLGRLCNASQLGAEILSASLPLSDPARRAIELHPELANLPLAGGDDYEILAAIAPGQASAFEAAAQSVSIPVTRIGILRPEPGVRIFDADGKLISLRQSGYDHFGL